jgi:hypothetical protein
LVGNQTSPVEYEFILSADEIAVEDRLLKMGGTLTDDSLTLV